MTYRQGIIYGFAIYGFSDTLVNIMRLLGWVAQ